MALGWCSRRGNAFWALGAVGVVIAAYGCGGSSNSDYNQAPPGGSAAHHAGAAGQAGTSSGGKGGASAGGSAGRGEVAAGNGGSTASGGSGATAGSNTGKAGASSGGSSGGMSASGGATVSGSGAGGETSGAGGEGGAPACNPNDTSVPFKTRCLACATDTCGTCLCNDCTDKVQTCQNTPGCQDIADCVIASGCNSEACYCGSYSLVECLAGQSNGPCKDVMLNAPGGHPPSAQNVSAGPATDAAEAVGLCAISGGPCANDCM